MATAKCSHTHVNEVPSKYKPYYDIEVQGRWVWRNGRRSHTTFDNFSTTFLSLSCLLCSLLFLYYVYILHNETAYEFNPQLTKTVNALESRVASLEKILQNFSKRSKEDSAVTVQNRRKRSTECVSREGNRGKKRNRSNHTRTIDIRGVQFISSNPDLFAVQPLQGVLGPWAEYPGNGYQMDSIGLSLDETNRKLKISHTGVYLIYSQVTFPATNESNSYSINLFSPSEKKDKPISICSAVIKKVANSEVSCYTTVLRLLRTGDFVYLQLERDRKVNFEMACTYFGVILLSGG